MKIIAKFDFNNGKSIVEKWFTNKLVELKSVISEIDAIHYIRQKSKEETMQGKKLYISVQFNQVFKV